MAKRGPLFRIRDALDIAAKLEADVKKKTAHDIAIVRRDGKLITTFGIRRGTRAGHGHLPNQLFLSQQQTKLLAACSISKAKYFEIIVSKLASPDQPKI